MKSGHTQREEDALSLKGRRDEGVLSLDAETLHSRSGAKIKVKKRASMCVWEDNLWLERAGHV